MTCRVKQAATADASIKEQVSWYLADERRGGEAVPKRRFDQLHQALATLATSPKSRPYAPENGKWMPEFELRQMLFPPWKSRAGWRVLYTIDEKQKLVTVLQIRHERRPHLHDASNEEE